MQPHRSTLARPTTTPAPVAPVAGTSRSVIGMSTMGMTGERDRGQIEEQGERVVREYEETRDRLAKAINSATYLLADLRNFNESEWTVRYPTLTRVEEPEQTATSPQRPKPKRGKTVSMSLSFADQPESVQAVEVAQMPEEVPQGRPAAGRRTFRRSITAVQALKEEIVAATAEQGSERPMLEEDDEMDEINGFSILRLNLSLGHASTSAQGAAATLITSLEKHSISRLISTRLESSLAHLAQLNSRIMSTSSRVLVTGDLNAGKSTVVNALLRRGGVDEFGWPEGVMPVDQQPLTGRFVEVYGLNGAAQEEVHVVKPGVKDGEYDRENAETFDVVKVQDLGELVAEQEASAPPLKVYLQRDADSSAPSTILHNGILDISLIDAPGLNRDVIPTTETFTRSPSIDVIIFVVSAANHFTLSAKEFILAAGQEKARMFIVVNRFDEVRDKEKCRRAVLEQIKTLSPKTWEERDELVHFVDSAKIAIQCSKVAENAAAAVDDAFAHLEQSLRSFVLLNRAKSKLGPAETYLTHLLADVELLASANAVVANTERSLALEQVERVKPVVEAMKRGQDGLEERLDVEEEQVGLDVRKVVSEGVEDALSRIAHGQLAISTRHAMPTYPGLLGVWDYATNVRRVMLKSLEHAVVALEEETKRITARHVDNVVAAGDAHLPSDVERSARVFNPDAMFGGKQAVVAARVGLGARTDLVHVTMSDLFDLSHQVAFFKELYPGVKNEQAPLINLSSLGTSFSALTLLTGTAGLGSSLFGLKTLLDSAVGLGDVFTDKTSRRWAGPVVGAIVLGSIVWIIHDLPRAIPVNVGRHLARSLRAPMEEDGAWTDAQEERMAREARKVIRLASWDLRERFRTALEARGKVVQEAERNERKARHAVEWFRGAEARVVDIRGEMGKSVFN
ncbi:mitofusin [Naganishia albida]|nr:mitofusin [Naganishia albida]